MGTVIIACMIFAISAGAFWLSFRSFRGRGKLLNNAWLYATEKQRQTMDKAPYYRQSGIVFALLGLVFLLNGFCVLLGLIWLSYAATVCMVITGVYAICSAKAIERTNRKDGA